MGGKAVFGGFEQKGVLYTGTREDVEKYAYNIPDKAGQVGVMLFAVLTSFKGPLQACRRPFCVI